MKKSIALVSLLMTTITYAEQGGNEALSVMATAKLAGSCESMGSLIEFQKAERLPGGEEFVVRFMEVELARLGLNMDAYITVCAQSIAEFERVWGSIGQASRID